MGACSQIETPRILGKYPLLELLGEGSLGSVYRSIDQERGCAVAVRILAEGIKWDEQLEDLFYRECRAIASLRHPNIASVFETGNEEQSFFIAMESLEGNDLKSLIARKLAMPVETKLSIMMQVVEGLSHAHKNGILHRNLSPGKIHLTADGVKVRDFAVAGILMKHLPRPAVRWGIPIYLSPEQIQNKSSDVQSDVYSAGIVFYELLTYFHPFHDPDGNKALDNMLLGAQIATFDQFPEIPPGVWAILRKCLATDPDDRYADMDDLLSACKNLIKDMSEDIQLMLAELQSSLAPLKKAAAQPNASEDILRLLHEIQGLLHDQKEADYASLDRLVTVLLEQHPTIQKTAGLLQPWGSVVCQLPLTAEANSPADPPLLSNPVSPGPMDSDTRGAADGGQPDSGKASLVSETTLEQKDEEPLPWSQDSVATPIKGHRQTTIPWRYGKIHKKTYSTAAALLSILLIVTAGYLVLGTEANRSVRDIWNIFTKNNHKTASASVPPFSSEKNNTPVYQAQDLNKTIPDRNPQDEPAALPLTKTEKVLEKNGGFLSRTPVPKALVRISDLIDSGNLPMAKVELDTFQKSHPGVPGIPALRKKWQERKSAEAQEMTRREEAKKQKENDWARQVTELFEAGKYIKASNILNLWLSEDPGNPRAHELAARNDEIQGIIKYYSSAITENRYQDALAALGRAEKLNPPDSTFSELQQQVEARKAAARASLTIRRLGAKAKILLDGKPIGKDGEVSNESVPIGRHTLAIENEGTSVSSKIQDMREGEELALVYDLAGRYVRPMIESDRELLVRRKLTEEVHHFQLEHMHGTLRGNCRGELLISYLDVAYKPSLGSHGFRIPIKLLKLRSDGKSIEFLFVSDGSRFQSFKFTDLQTAEKFKLKWDELKSKVPR
jgi:tetratricopeptide (TPR) repeat protein